MYLKEGYTTNLRGNISILINGGNIMFFREKIALSTFLDEIQNELKSRHFLATLIMSLMVPDVCNGENADGDDYKKWVEKYYRQHSCISEDFTADVVYMLRCSILHSAKTYKNISLRYNSKADYYLGHLSVIIHDNNTGKETREIGLNINEFAEEMIASARAYMADNGEDPLLFSMIDYDKIQY